MIDCWDPLSVRHQCQLLGLDHSGLSYPLAGPNAEVLALGHRLDELYPAHPHSGVGLMRPPLRREGRVIHIPSGCGGWGGKMRLLGCIRSCL